MKKKIEIPERICRMCMFELEFLFTLFFTLLRPLWGNSSQISLSNGNGKKQKEFCEELKKLFWEDYYLGSLNYHKKFKYFNLYNLAWSFNSRNFIAETW